MFFEAGGLSLGYFFVPGRAWSTIRRSVPAETSVYTLDPAQLEAAFAALRKAADTFRPSPREVRLHRWQGRCAKLAVIALGGIVAGGFLGGPILIGLLALTFLLASGAAALLLLVNLSLIAGTLRQRRLLKKLGLHTISRSAWKAERRRRFGGRIGGATLTTVGAILTVVAGLMLPGFIVRLIQGGSATISVVELFSVVLFGVAGMTLLLWRMVERSREQLALVADADRLRAMLTSMQAESGSGAPVVVPAAVMEKVAGIEGAQIARERAQAVVASVGSADRGYALVVAPDATAQKAALDRGDRIAVEELIDEVLADPQAVGSPDAGSVRHVRSADGLIEIDYSIDQAAERVHLLAVRAAGTAVVGI